MRTVFGIDVSKASSKMATVKPKPSLKKAQKKVPSELTQARI